MSEVLIDSDIEILYKELVHELSMLRQKDYPKAKLGGYEDALWDFKCIVNDKFKIPLMKIAPMETTDNMVCSCGHLHKEHLPTSSINYTAGRCTKCICKNFIMKV